MILVISRAGYMLQKSSVGFLKSPVTHDGLLTYSMLISNIHLFFAHLGGLLLLDMDFTTLDRSIRKRISS